MDWKLETIDVNIKTDIVASIQDGASVMKKYGHLMPFENQFCFNHEINLAILDVFYVRIPEIEDSDNS